MIGFIHRLKQALISTSNQLTSGIEQIFFKQKLDDQSLNALEELLISADIGSFMAAQLVASLKSAKFDQEVSSNQVKQLLAATISKILLPSHAQLILVPRQLNIIVVCGVNGNGKTTTIGKLAAFYQADGKKVAVAACDTFRAAAVEQLENWADQSGALLVKGSSGSDPASVAFSAVQIATDQNIDLLLIDTAGRLHNYQNLMDELGKIIRVVTKAGHLAQHHCLLVLDATTGQNAYNQVEQFKQVAGVTGLVVTKLDGTAKAGSLVGIVQKFALPIYFIGIGEQIDDLKPFEPSIFAKMLVGLEPF